MERWHRRVRGYERFLCRNAGWTRLLIIWEQTDTSKGRGQKITFTIGSGFYDEPHIGEAVFETQADYEEFLENSHEMVVDWARHGTKVSERAEEVMGMRGEIISGFNIRQGEWMGRLKSEQLFMMFRESLPSENVVYANSKTRDTLTSADTLDWDEIISDGRADEGQGRTASESWLAPERSAGVPQHRCCDDRRAVHPRPGSEL